MTHCKTIALLSGGLDSATAAAIAKKEGHEVLGLSFNYGQRHIKELKAAEAIANDLSLKKHQIIDVDLSAWGGSSLTDLKQPIPNKGVKANLIPNTYVPGRNTVFIAVGLSMAEAVGAKQIVLGINAMDYSGYPDCRPDYIDAYQSLANLSSKAGREGKGIKLWAPLINWDKTKILKEAFKLNVPVEKTWSCYSEKESPCGVCDSCRIRNTALKKIGREDLCSN